MRRLLLLAAMLGMVLLAASPAFAQNGDIDCDQVGGPIPTPPGDPDNLDADGDGLACEFGGGETNPGEIDTMEGPTPGEMMEIPAPTLEGTCEGIVLQEDFEACIAAQEQYAPETSAPAPAPAASTTMTALPDTGGPALLPIAGLLLVVGGLVVRRR